MPTNYNDKRLLKLSLESVITRHDMAESKKRGYNYHALPQYLQAMDSMLESNDGSTRPKAEDFFCDRLLTKINKALDLAYRVSQLKE